MDSTTCNLLFFNAVLGKHGHHKTIDLAPPKGKVIGSNPIRGTSNLAQRKKVTLIYTKEVLTLILLSLHWR
jgi:hypothetical protein